MIWLVGLFAALVLAQASPVPSPSSTPLARMTPNPKFCIANADIDKNIDTRLPEWMKREVRTRMLELDPCARYDVQLGDAKGRAVFNRYERYQEYLKQTAGLWQRIDSATVRDPAGTRVYFPTSPPPDWLLGVFNCAAKPGTYSSNMRLRLLANGTGWEREAGEAVAARIELFAYNHVHGGDTLTLAYAHANAYRFQVEREPRGIHIIGNEQFEDSDGWVALPNVFEWTCARAPN